MSRYNSDTGDFLKSIAVLVALVVFVFVMAVLIFPSATQQVQASHVEFTGVGQDNNPLQL